MARRADLGRRLALARVRWPQTINALSARVCADRGHPFPAREAQLDATATTRPPLSTGRPEWVDVSAITYDRHEKPDKPPSLKVSYHCGLLRHHEWVCLPSITGRVFQLSEAVGRGFPAEASL